MSELSDDVNNALASAAFPLLISQPHSIQIAPGLSKRELFAAMALSALVSGTDGYSNAQDFARRACELSDALIAALEATTSSERNGGADR